MPELLTEHPKIAMKILSKMGATCGKGPKRILKSCPTENFCSIPKIGEFCVLGTDQADQLTQFKASVESGLTGGQNEFNSFDFMLLLLLIILFLLVIYLGCSAYREFRKNIERRENSKQN